MPTAHHLILTHIARNTPLARTLACIANSFEEQHPGLSCAILLPPQDSRQLRLGAAAGLPQDYCRAIDGIAIDAEIPATEQIRGRLEELATQYGLHTCAAIPIGASADRQPGMFVIHARQSDQASEQCRQTAADMCTLASLAIERDIDQARIEKAEATLRENETRMALAIEGSGTGIWDRNVVSGEIHYSDQWKAILGYAPSELTTRIEDSYTRVHPDDLAGVQAAIQAHFDQKSESYSVEHRILCKDGSYKWIASRGKVASRDAYGKPLRMIGTTTDITERKQTHLLLEQAREQLLQTEKLAAIGQLAAGVAHEINSPIGFVSTNLSQFVEYIDDMFLLISEYELGEPQLSGESQTAIDAIRDRIDMGFIKEDVPLLLSQTREGLERVRKIVYSLRDFSRVDIGQEWHICDIHSGIESTLNIVWSELKCKAHVHKEFDLTLPDVECVGAQINQVILNLLLNAAHSIESNGDIWIRTGSGDGQIFVEVADNGAGMTPEVRTRIFEPFFTTRQIGEGSGLGLSVSYGIIQKHGGRIDVKSEPQRGSSFTIWLPVRHSARA